MVKHRSSTRGKGKAQGKDEVDEYLKAVDPDSRSALENLREQIAAAAPHAEEGFSYGVPAFKLNGRPLVCYAAFKNHCGFYPMSPAVITAHADELSEYETAKGTVKFSVERPLPAALVGKLVKARIAEVRAGGK